MTPNWKLVTDEVREAKQPAGSLAYDLSIMRPWGLLHSLSNVTKEALLLQADVVIVVVVAVRRGRLQPGVRQRLIVAGVAAVAAGDRQGLAQASGNCQHVILLQVNRG